MTLQRKDLDLLKGAIDMHVHAAPDLHPRLLDEMEVCIEARKFGMRAIVFKSHYAPNADRMLFIRKNIQGIDAFGGIVLNPHVGGLNPYAVEACLRFGGKVVWMPSLFSEAHLKWLREHHATTYGTFAKEATRLPPKGIRILNEKNELLPEVIEILGLIADFNAILATSHLSVEESRILVKEAKNYGVKKIVITHPYMTIPNMPRKIQIELAREGAYLEHCFSALTPMWLSVSIDEVVQCIKEAEPERCIISTDLGQVHNPSPVEGLRVYICSLLEKGLSPSDIEVMVKKNPEKLLYE
ncbi:MAG: DUF6282 family protein [Candidatus Bathyarchaeia archaeon]